MSERPKRCTCCGGVMGMNYDSGDMRYMCVVCGHTTIWEEVTEEVTQEVPVVAGVSILYRDDVKDLSVGYHLPVWEMLCEDLGLDPATTESITVKKGG